MRGVTDTMPRNLHVVKICRTLALYLVEGFLEAARYRLPFRRLQRAGAIAAHNRGCSVGYASVQAIGMLKITALQDVRIYGNVVSYKVERIGDALGRRPINTPMWIDLGKGDSRSDISLFNGVDPRFLPGEVTECVGRNLFVVGYSPGQNSEAFQALVQVEEVGT